MLKIYHRVNCKSSFVIYLLDLIDNISISATCSIQGSGKSETPFNIRLNNLRKDVKIPMQYQLANISTGMIMTLTITENSLSSNN